MDDGTVPGDHRWIDGGASDSCQATQQLTKFAASNASYAEVAAQSYAARRVAEDDQGERRCARRRGFVQGLGSDLPQDSETGHNLTAADVRQRGARLACRIALIVGFNFVSEAMRDLLLEAAPGCLSFKPARLDHD